MQGEARNGVWVVPSIKNTCYNGTQMIKTKLISEKIMIYPGASAPGKFYLASPLCICIYITTTILVNDGWFLG
jgi:hypothetical protein